MKWFKKWFYFIVFAAVGVFYFSCIDEEFRMLGTAFAKESVSGGEAGIEVSGNETAASAPEGNSEDVAENIAEETVQGESTDGENSAGADSEGVNPAGEDAVAANLTGDNSKVENIMEVNGEPVYVTVEDSYFSDAVFIGDSRTVGMYEYGGLEEISTFYASKGLTIYKIFDAAIVDVPGQKKKITVEEALQEHTFSKIYLMVGINEMGTGTVDTFVKKYEEVVEHLRELQPDAIIYIQGIFKVSTERSNQGDYINNEGIEARNIELEKLADNRNVFYLDANPMVCDETGGMVKSYSFDGVHLKAQYIELWKNFLKEHAIER